MEDIIIFSRKAEAKIFLRTLLLRHLSPIKPLQKKRVAGLFWSEMADWEENYHLDTIFSCFELLIWQPH